ncbi:hypothetical protein H6G54_29855 [Anabaena cylindrica FACHB-243]|jgi:phage-related protein|uniref:Plasmid stabilization system n=1 Tax=Anabaena cylindrica (strain ATCC 27899 / PCC 7122) TaxID=272123 RepID=K9ZRR0_ANACC|nr:MULTISPECIES: hypothetical protein [Anabaena]AFZ61065.1 hypothetical protein Anacy_5764 [Anabaena cylindrica PCC 7122]MBD2421806.1 hypothetical protein [Anabaena cylindrica FACHB-243]MBY5284590.1 hypothetical protein [Anabaena sp. CCAP 1446/1C]MBY5306423.1 hypothetical protein [Anabaena sp. CCAP 1446/1C]MCM2408063.1 hypothetical protein [Anabaena sp. CCAP 1446/1C]
MNIKFRLIFTSKAQKQLDALAHQDRKQYHKAFQFLSKFGSSYRSLRTHRYQTKGGDIWSSSASMAKRFYWHFLEEHIIVVTHLDSH